MLTIRTPLRCSLLGGSSDYEPWYKQHGGAVIGGAIRQYSYFQTRLLPPFHPHRTRLAYSQIETVTEHRHIQHRAIKAVLQELNWLEPGSPGLEIAHFADLPSSSGTGSSSTFVVGLLHALLSLQGKYVNPQELRQRAIKVEREILGECVGDQDQTFAAHGGFHLLEFRKTGEISFWPLLDEVDLIELEQHLLMIYTQPRQQPASEVAKSFVPYLTTKMVEPQFALRKLTDEGVKAIEKKDWERLGGLIDQSWKLKQLLSPVVATPFVQEVSMKGLCWGAWGGKLMGAGGGGCYLFVVAPDKRQQVLDHLPPGIIEIPLRFSLEGSRRLHN